MATSTKNRKAKRPTYADALKAMREDTERNVEAAINASYPVDMPKAPRSQRQGSAGREVHCFFDGIVSALAMAVFDAARPGMEVEMAELIAQRLVQKVHSATCEGRC